MLLLLMMMMMIADRLLHSKEPARQKNMAKDKKNKNN